MALFSGSLGMIKEYQKISDRPNRTDLTIWAIIEYISDSKIQSGDKLPTEKELCNILGVGTRAIREALMSLKALGVLRPQHGTGWYLEQFNPVRSLGFLSKLIESFGKSDLDEVMEARMIIEPMIARKAAQSLSSAARKQLERVFATMKKTIANPSQHRMADLHFHNLLANECDNSVLSMQSTMLNSLFRYVPINTSEDAIKGGIEEHQAIFDAVMSNNSQAAEEAMRKHLANAYKYFAEESQECLAAAK